MRKFQLDNRVAFVSGAAAGIGRAIAVSLAKRGAIVVLGDIDQAGLDTTAELVASVGATPTISLCDVTSASDVNAISCEITAKHGRLDLLVNNAGVGLQGNFNQYCVEDFEWVMNINLIGMVRLTKALMPILQAAPEARIVNLSSVLGIVATPGAAAYCTSKFAVRGFSDALRYDLNETNIGVTIVHPGGVNTRLAADARIPLGVPKAESERFIEWSGNELTRPPELVGEIIVKAVEKRTPRVIIGADAKVLVFLERFFPGSSWKIAQYLTFRK